LRFDKKNNEIACSKKWRHNALKKGIFVFGKLQWQLLAKSHTGIDSLTSL